MNTIEKLRHVLDKQSEIAIWYAKYEGRDESIRYANEKFAETFGLSIDEILKRKTYDLVNPADTTAMTIERYKNEDFQAIDHGQFVSRSRMSTKDDIVVVKLSVDQGVLGMFRIVESVPAISNFTLSDLDEEFQHFVKLINPNLMN